MLFTIYAHTRLECQAWLGLSTMISALPGRPRPPNDPEHLVIRRYCVVTYVLPPVRPLDSVLPQGFTRRLLRPLRCPTPAAVTYSGGTVYDSVTRIYPD